MIKTEWSNLRKNRFLIIVLIAILTIPTIYTTLFLSSMWDPYGKVSDLPVAVVNEDKAVEYNDKQVSIGEDLVEQLKESDALKFNFVSSKEAKVGLENGTYYMIVTIPSDFSSNAITLLDENPKQMTLYYDTNPGMNFIASKMCESAVAHLKDNVSKSVTSFYTMNVFSQFDEVKEGFQSAIEGTDSLSSGLLTLSEGQNKLIDGLGSLSTRMTDFTNGTFALKDGIGQYTDGVTAVNNGITTLETGSRKLANGLSQLNDALKDVSISQITLTDENKTKIAEAVSEKVGTYSAQLSQGIAAGVTNQIQGSLTNSNTILAISQGVEQNAAIQQMEKALISTGYSKEQADSVVQGIVSGTLNAASSNISAEKINSSIADSVSATMSQVASVSAVAGAQGVITNVNSSMNSFSETLNKMKSATQSLSSGADSLNEGVRKLHEGTNQLVSQNEQLVDGITSIDAGAIKIKDAMGKLESGSDTVGDGIDSAYNGSVKLSDGLTTGADSIDSSLKNVSDSTYDMFSDPINTVETKITNVQNNGSSMAAYMMTVAVWVAGMAFCLVYPIERNKNDLNSSALSFWMGKASVMYPLACAFSMIMVGALYLVNGLRPEHLLKTIIVAIVSAITFMSILYFFNVALKKAGAFAMFIFMVVQLSGSTGTYPTQLSASYVETITNYLPFTYSIRAFRSSLSSDMGIKSELIILLSVFIVFNILSFTYFALQDRKNGRIFVAEIEG